MKTNSLSLHIKSLVVAFALLSSTFATFSANTETLTPPLHGQELGCLAMNIYHEARGETEKGKLAVAAVTMNRVKNKHYPDTICEVVWQRKQFSWTDLKIKYHVIKNTKAWINAIEIARLFTDGGSWPGVGKATHYHTTAVSPNWKDDDRLITQVGSHLFYAL